ncbi:MAG TPA: hypothetical protein VGR37_20785 [Longimicrobiaceae bacterium]|nr:hypothetical protein [Longimicrobiaceae bacterium]
MSRMRLMEGGAGATALVCLYCGAETESKPPYEVMYCDCRSVRDGCDAVSRPTLPSVGRAA